MLVDERVELADHLRVAADGDLRLGTLLDELEAQLAETRDLGLRERLVGELGQRVAAKKGERLAQQPCAPRRIARPRLVDQHADTGQIELIRLQADPVAGRARLDRLGAERLAELRDEVLERRRRGRRRLTGPERVDQAVGRDDAAGVEQEQGEQRALLRAAERDHLSVDRHLERAQDPELDHLLVVTGSRASRRLGR